MLDDEKSGQGDLDEPGTGCTGRKRVFSQSDVELDLITDRKKINPFSSALSTSPYNQAYLTSNLPQHPFSTVRNNANLTQAKEFYPKAAQGLLDSVEPAQEEEQLNSSFGGMPNFSESLTLNDGTTVMDTQGGGGGAAGAWNLTSTEFVPKSFN